MRQSRLVNGQDLFLELNRAVDAARSGSGSHGFWDTLDHVASRTCLLQVIFHIDYIFTYRMASNSPYLVITYFQNIYLYNQCIYV